MGWKTFKEYFQIKHIVNIKNGYLLIGSEYVADLVKIELSTGVLQEHETFDTFLKKIYPQLIGVGAAELLELIQKEDTFTHSIQVFTYENADLVEKQCEALGWPNVTHDGCLMYENTFSTDKNVILKKIKRNLQLDKENNEKRLAELELQIAKLKSDMEQNQTITERFNAEHPELICEDTDVLE